MAGDPEPLPLDEARRTLHANVVRVRDRIANACRQAGRASDTVTLVAVTKYVSAGMTRLVRDAGVVDLAESRPQSLWDKAASLATQGDAARWHLIGHLQRNKIRRTLPLLSMLQSLDSLRLLEAIEAEAIRSAEAIQAAEAIPTAGSPIPPLDVLVEINLTDDPGRSGVLPVDAPRLVAAAARSSAIRLQGLMGMAARPDSGSDARRDFARLRSLRDDLAATTADPMMLRQLSMGMSGDFEAGILEGATIVRIGSALVEGLV